MANLLPIPGVASANTMKERLMAPHHHIPSTNGIFITASRLQELLAVEQQYKQWFEIVNELAIGIIYIDTAGIVHMANRAAIELLDQPLEKQRWCHIIDRAFKPQNDDGNNVTLHNGKRVHITTSPIASPPGQIITLHDQTRQQVLQEWDAEQKRLTQMGKMIANLAHQLRTPLTSALIYASHLLNTELPEVKRQQFSESILARLKDLERQISDILFFAKGGKTIVDKYSIDELFHLISESIEARLQSVSVHVYYENYLPGQYLFCNQTSLKGAIENLIINALEACANTLNAQVRVQIKKIKQQVVISVTDNGPGIAESDLKQIKQPFFTTKAKGTGLGLAVVEAIACAHHGCFEVKSKLGLGTAMKIYLPEKSLSNKAKH